MGLIGALAIGAASGAGTGAAQAAQSYGNMLNASQLQNEMASLQEQKAESVAQYQYNLEHAPEVRAGQFISDALNNPAAPTAPTAPTATPAVAPTPETPSDAVNNAIDAAAQYGPGSNQTFGQNDSQTPTGTQTPVGLINKPPSQIETLLAAKDAAFAKGDMQAVQQIQAAIGGAIMIVPRGGEIYNTNTGETKVNQTFEDMAAMKDAAAQAKLSATMQENAAKDAARETNYNIQLAKIMQLGDNNANKLTPVETMASGFLKADLTGKMTAQDALDKATAIHNAGTGKTTSPAANKTPTSQYSDPYNGKTPPGLPAGSTYLGRSQSSGNPVYSKPDGSKVEIR